MTFRRWLVSAITCLIVTGPARVVAEAADAAKGATLDAIVQGAKREGKLSWSTNLEDHEVRELHKVFQQEYPFIKINYKKDYGRRTTPAHPVGDAGRLVPLRLDEHRGRSRRRIREAQLSN